MLQGLAGMGTVRRKNVPKRAGMGFHSTLRDGGWGHILVPMQLSTANLVF